MSAPSAVEAVGATTSGQVIAAGRSSSGISTWRLTPGGAVDVTYGDHGVGHLAPTMAESFARVAAVAPDGSAVVGGMAGGNGAVVRILPSGAPDPSFGNGGAVTFGGLGGSTVGGITLQPDGSVVALAGADIGADVVRLTANGHPDPTFGPRGAATPAGFITVLGPVLQPDGKVLVGGFSLSGSSGGCGCGAPLGIARLQGGSGPVVTAAPTLSRLSGADRVATAIAESSATYASGGLDAAASGNSPTDASGKLLARAVVLTGATSFADALAALPFSSYDGGPLLLTPSDHLDDAVLAEIKRVLGSPSSNSDLSPEVDVVGGDLAVSPAVVDTLVTAGYTVKRFAGADRYTTAVAVAKAIGGTRYVEANGRDYPDGIAAGVAGANIGAPLLLTDGSTLPPAAATLLSQKALQRFAVGGPAAAADPTATPIVGQDRYATAALVATEFFGTPTTVGIARGDDFADALTGGAMAAASGAPILLTPPNAANDWDRLYLTVMKPWTHTLVVFGGQSAVSDAVASAYLARLS
jgi:uncharacterized delta-60 repeat protein